MKLSLNQIRLDGGTQPRTSLDIECIARYERDMREGVRFDPIEVVYDGTEYWCWDGFHRCHAARRAGMHDIEANITQGTLDEAKWLSVGANKRHGLPRTNADKVQAVRTALSHPMGAKLSDGAIAQHAGVSQPFVGKVRRSMTTTHNGFESTTRVGRNGRTINTANIGKGKRKRRSRDEIRISRKARPPILGHSPPNPMIPLQFSPNNAQTAAATLFREFSRPWLEQLIVELNHLLSQVGAES